MKDELVPQSIPMTTEDIKKLIEKFGGGISCSCMKANPEWAEMEDKERKEYILTKETFIILIESMGIGVMFRDKFCSLSCHFRESNEGAWDSDGAYSCSLFKELLGVSYVHSLRCQKCKEKYRVKHETH